ncbi:MAG TPA: SRPBCC family protein [Solirubrobacterales bacterium]|nr:SRPBCC family protein [Solirubrobacterales bacterium]
MGPVSSEIEIDAPREAAFELIGDLSRRPSFTNHFLSDFHLTRIESSGVGAGARFRLHLPLNSAWMETTITELEEPFRILEHGRGGRDNRIPAVTLWELTERGGSLTTVRVSHWTEPSQPLDKVRDALGASSFWSERRWRQVLRRLRDLLEAEGVAEDRIAVAGGNRYATGIP